MDTTKKNHNEEQGYVHKQEEQAPPTEKEDTVQKPTYRRAEDVGETPQDESQKEFEHQPPDENLKHDRVHTVVESLEAETNDLPMRCFVCVLKWKTLVNDCNGFLKKNLKKKIKNYC